MNIGYARVSTDDQHPTLQRKALTADGCAHVFEDQGMAPRRPGFDQALSKLEAGSSVAAA